MKKVLTIIGVIAILVACVLLRKMTVVQAEKMQAQAIQQSMIPQVELMAPLEVETSSSIDSPGRIVAVKTADVVARVHGMILSQHYKDGDYVQQGQLLYTIDPQEYQIAVDRAKANLDSAKAQQYSAQKDFERAAELVKNDYISKSSYDQALAAKDAANASVSASYAALNDAKRLLSYTQVTAPISGKISMPDVTVGNYLSSPNMVLTKIVSVDPIYATYSLDSSLFNQLKNDEILPSAGQKQKIKAELILPDGTKYKKTGTVDFSDNVISKTTGSITLRATFPNPDASLIPGDFVNVKVYSNKLTKKLAVPQSAVMQDMSGKYLFVIDSENVAHRRDIETDGQKDNNWIISKGIAKDEKFISTGLIKVRDNAKVQVVSKEETKKIEASQNAEQKESKSTNETKQKG